MKRVIALCLVLLICIGLFSATANASEPPFSDMNPGAYYVDAVRWAVENNITKGISNSEFGPDEICTRAQVVTFLWRSAGSPTPTSSYNPFVDVDSNKFYYNAVLWAMENGITTGTSRNKFSPDDACTRGQVATFLWRTKGEPEIDSGNSFVDVSASTFYYDAVLWAVENGVTNGIGNSRFAPDAYCTRGQIVTFLYRASNIASITPNLLILPELPFHAVYAYVIGKNDPLIHQSASISIEKINYSFRDNSDGTVDLTVNLSGSFGHVYKDGRHAKLRCTISNDDGTYSKTTSLAAYKNESFSNHSIVFYDIPRGEYTLTFAKSVSD